MRPQQLLLAALALVLTSFASAWPKLPVPPADGRQAFFGKIIEVNRAAKTITLWLGSSLVFHYNDQTRITDASAPLTIDQVKPEEGAEIVMRPDSKGNRIALTIQLDHKVPLPSEPVAHTVQGKTIMGPRAMQFIIYKPPTIGFARAIDFGPRAGTFRLTILPDGTVASVKPLHTLGSKELDERAASWLKKWKFQPHSLTEFEVPMSYDKIRR